MRRHQNTETELVKETRTIMITYIVDDNEINEIKSKCHDFGDIRDIYMIPDRNTMFVVFYDIRQSCIAKNSLDCYKIGEKEIKTYFSLGRHEIPGENEQCSEKNNQGTLLLCCKDLAEPPSEAEILDIFSEFGEIKEIRNCKVFQKYVEFYDSRCAVNMFENFGERPFKNGKIYLKYMWDMSTKNKWEIVRETDKILSECIKDKGDKCFNDQKEFLQGVFDSFIADNINDIGHIVDEYTKKMHHEQ